MYVDGMRIKWTQQKTFDLEQKKKTNFLINQILN